MEAILVSFRSPFLTYLLNKTEDAGKEAVRRFGRQRPGSARKRSGTDSTLKIQKQRRLHPRRQRMLRRRPMTI